MNKELNSTSSEEDGLGKSEAQEAMSLEQERELRKQLALDHAKSWTPPVKHGEEDYDLDKYPVREWSVQIPGLSEPIAFNPVTSLIGVSCLWGLAIWCMIDPDGSALELTSMRSDVTLYYSWLFISTRCIFLFFLFFIAYKYGHIKLAPTPDEPPEFSTLSYFMMIFAAGVAVALFVYGVAEPLFHQESHWFANQKARTQDEIDMFAINITVTNWGLTAWAPYLIVAVSMGLAGHRFGLPMTFRSCFYPILGDYTWGWMGDFVDGFTIVTTVSGVCTSLGLGAINIVAGFQFLGWVEDDIDQDRETFLQNMTIWGITCVATISVLSGLHQGVQLLSQVAFCFGMLLFLLIFSMDNTKYLMNLQVQEVGYYLQHSIFELNFWTDAFGQLREGDGRAVDGEAGAVWWMDAWMVFYQAWWIAWASFVGLFIARISRGRTVGEVIMFSLIVPVLYCILWFSVWGGVAIRQSRQGLELETLGDKFFNDSAYFLVPGSDFCYDVPQDPVFNPDKPDEMIYQNHLPGVTPVCQFNPDDAESAAYNVLYSFSYPETFGGEGMGPTLSVIFILALAIYFATSSDSGSLIVDHLASNGRLRHHWAQRLFWAVTEGAVATALLTAGGSNALAAVQAGSVIAGLPFCFMLCFLMQSIWVFCDHADKHSTGEFKTPVQPEFTFPIYGGILNVFEFLFSLGSVNPKRIERNMDLPTSQQAVEFLTACFVPMLPLYQVLSAAYPRNTTKNLVLTLFYALIFLAWVGLFCAYNNNPGVLGWGWACLFANSIILCTVRHGFRVRYNIRSTFMADWACSLFMYPQVISQLKIQCLELGLPADHSDEDYAEEKPVETDSGVPAVQDTVEA